MADYELNNSMLSLVCNHLLQCIYWWPRRSSKKGRCIAVSSSSLFGPCWRMHMAPARSPTRSIIQCRCIGKSCCWLSRFIRGETDQMDKNVSILTLFNLRTDSGRVTSSTSLIHFLPVFVSKRLLSPFLRYVINPVIRRMTTYPMIDIQWTTRVGDRQAHQAQF
jgi:hypothetical protein